jgi:DNA primase
MSQYDLSRPVLEQVREAADIVAVVGEHLTLRKTGRNYVGLCPFHGEKTGSFNVSREKGTYYCFGCKRGGDVIDFVMEMERVTFAEAVERLADRFGVRLPPASPEARRRRDEQEQLADVMEAAQAVFARQLSQDRPRAFLERRGVPLDVAAEFGLGFARNEWRALYDELRKKFSERALVGAGLVVEGEGGKVWDRFRDRITIPIRSARGRIIAYGGRALGDENPKYLNSPETSLFSKGHVLFALDRAMRAFPKANRAVVVEGYFDCIALHRVGLTETVATLGTALSEHHAAELARRVPHVVVCFDGDAAGRQAAVAALRTLLAAALEVSVLVLPDGQDPDDVARREGAEGFGRRVATALPADAFLLRSMGESPLERRQNLQSMMEIARACSDPVRRIRIQETLAFGAGIPLEELRSLEIFRVMAAQAATEQVPENAELALLRSFLHDLEPAASAEHLRGFPIDGICHPGVRRVFEVLQRRLANGGGIEIVGVLSEIEDPADRRLLAGLELEAPQTPHERIPSLVDLVRRRADRLRSSEIIVRIRAAELAGDRDALARLQAEQSELIKRPKRGA